jgi:uncharacterized protein (TIGR00725 family)
MKYKIGVYGSAKDENKDIVEAAIDIGRIIAENNCILVTGGCTGVPYEAVKSMKKHNGFTVGVSPASTLQEHKEKFGFPTENFDLLIFTGFGKKGRNVVSLLSCDAAIFISGGSGTLNEFTIAYDEGKVCGVLLGTGGMTGIVEELEKNIIGGRKKGSGTIIYESDPEKLIRRVIEKLEVMQ